MSSDLEKRVEKSASEAAGWFVLSIIVGIVGCLLPYVVIIFLITAVMCLRKIYQTMRLRAEIEYRDRRADRASVGCLGFIILIILGIFYLGVAGFGLMLTMYFAFY